MRARIVGFTVLLACLVLTGCGGAGAVSTPGPSGGSAVGSDQGSVGASLPAPGCGADLSAGSSSIRTVTVVGVTRTARLHVPSGYDPSRPTPVILAFVGHGMPVDRLEDFSDLDDSGALVLYPEPAGTDPQNGWQGAPYASGADDVAFVVSLLADTQAHACVDASRVYAVGISNGAGFVSLLSCRMPDRFAAFAAVSAAIYPEDNPPCPRVPGVPIVDFHGTADPVIPYEGGSSHGDALEPVTQWLTEQAQRGDCAASPTRTRIGDDVIEEQWGGCEGRGAQSHYTVEGGGHTWPGATRESGPGATTQTISATRIIEDFFATHRLG